MNNAIKNMQYTDFNVANFTVLMFRKINDKYIQMDKKKIQINKNEWRYHNKDFTTFDINKVAFSDNKKNYYAFDYDTGEQLTFTKKGMPKKITIDEVDIYVNRNIIEQIVRGLEIPKVKGQYVMLIIGLAMGIAIGIVVGMYLPQATKTVEETPKFLWSLVRSALKC